MLTLEKGEFGVIYHDMYSPGGAIMWFVQYNDYVV